MTKIILQYQKYSKYVYLCINNRHSTEDLINKIKEVEQSALKDGWTNLNWKFDYSLDEFDNVNGQYLCLYGDHLETDKQYQDRINSIKLKNKCRIDEYLRLKKYYESDNGKQELLENML